MNVFMNAKQIKDGCISEAVSLGDFVYVSAQTGQGSSIEEQAISACHQLFTILEDFGLSSRHIVKTTVFLKDIHNRDAFLSMYKTMFEAPYPACSIVAVSDLEKEAMVGIEAFAINTLRYEKEMKNACCSQDCDSCSGC